MHPTDPTAVTFRMKNVHPLIRFNNWIGERSRGKERPWTTLDAEDLIREARRKVKWDDFGSEDFREPMGVLLKAGREEARLTYSGQSVLYGMVLNGLCTRLRIQREVHAHPEIRDQPVKRPLIIVGAPRTGTTLLNNLLSQDPVSRPLLGWEGGCPAPVRPGLKRGKTPWDVVVAAAINDRFVKAMVPEICRMHPFGWSKPDECHWLLFPSFVFPAAMALSEVHTWMVSQPDGVYDQAYAGYRLALQLLEWQRPAQSHWVLKSPLHLWALGSLARAVPEASFIHPHRSLDEVLPSMCSLAAALMTIFSDAVEPKALGPIAMQLARESIARFTRARQDIAPGRILDLRYPELVADPVAAVKRVYDTFGYEYTPAFERRMKVFLADRKKSVPAPHVYSLGQFNLSKDEILTEFGAYHRDFGLA